MPIPEKWVGSFASAGFFARDQGAIPHLEKGVEADAFAYTANRADEGNPMGMRRNLRFVKLTDLIEVYK
jgi:hypothetical protein